MQKGSFGQQSRQNRAILKLKANRYNHSGCDGRHEGKVVWQFEEISNCPGESNIAIDLSGVRAGR